ncbi:MAG: IS630 family transposase [Alphaproteobacteria bacterium]|nr:IS630 family transposase [Alphaproteobacteria bacterium]
MRQQEQVVKLSGKERTLLQGIIRSGKSAAQKQTRARILLHADKSKDGSKWSDARIAQAVGCCHALCGRIRRQYAQEGLEAVLNRSQRDKPAVEKIFDGEKEAKLIALACSPPPPGQAGWTLRMLANKAVELKIVDQTSHSTVGFGFKKNELKPHLKKQWVIPPEANAAFVAAMEDVLAVYQRPRDLDLPLVCLDESSKQLLTETRNFIPMTRGRVARHDYEYQRNGTANLFMVFAPLEGWRHVKVTDRRTAIDYAHMLREISDKHFPGAKKIVLVQDNLNTHKPASLYEAFPPEEARRLVERFEWHYTPKHGSWLDMAESELGVLSKQCLDRRIPDKAALAREIAAWVKHRNKHHAKANWQFTTADARVKLKHLYPTF